MEEEEEEEEIKNESKQIRKKGENEKAQFPFSTKAYCFNNACPRNSPPVCTVYFAPSRTLDNGEVCVYVYRWGLLPGKTPMGKVMSQIPGRFFWPFL
jgi:hypothetical protein